MRSNELESSGVHYTVTDELSEETRRVLFGWDADPFQAKAWSLTWRPKHSHVVAYLNGQPVSHVGFVRENVRVGAENLAVAGFGDVITVPGFQRRGLAQKTIEVAASVLVEQWHVRHGLLFCFPHLLTYYERIGWTARKEPVWVAQPAGRISLPVFSLVQAWQGAEWPAGEIEIEGLPW